MLWGLIIAQFVGLSTFSAPSEEFPCERVIETINHSRYPAMSILWGPFGDSLQCVRRFLESNSNRAHLLQVHVQNGVCRRNGRCTERDFLPGHSVEDLDSGIRSELNFLSSSNPLPQNAIIPSYAALIAKIRASIEPIANQNTIMVLGDDLETRQSHVTNQVFHDVIRLVWPWVHVSSHNRKLFGPVGLNLLEKHGGSPGFRDGLCIANNDGTKLSKNKARRFVQKYSRRCVATFVWLGSLQGRSGAWKPYDQRDYILSDEDKAWYSAVFAETTSGY